MCKHAVNAGGVIHRQIEPSDGAIAPAHDSHFGNIEMIKERDCIAREVVIVEIGKVCIRRSAFASNAVSAVSAPS